jgi:hypothetical protein
LANKEFTAENIERIMTILPVNLSQLLNLTRNRGGIFDNPYSNNSGENVEENAQENAQENVEGNANADIKTTNLSTNHIVQGLKGDLVLLLGESGSLMRQLHRSNLKI